MSRVQRKQIAQQTLVILAEKSYDSPTGIKIDFTENIDQSISQTIIYSPGDYSAVLNAEPRKNEENCQFIFCTKLTLDCVKDILQESPDLDVVALNFASAKNPGGGFIKGSQAQEESIARASGIYSSLTTPHVSSFYKDNFADKTCLYTHSIIYSPKIPVFRDSDDNILENPYYCSFITSPAVNASHAVQRVGFEKVQQTMMERTDRVLGVAMANGHQVIVLGAWGCGVFGNKVEDVAKYFREYLMADGAKYKDSFSKIYFAIPEAEKLNLFQSIFDGSYIPPPTIHKPPPSPQSARQYKTNPKKNNRKEKRLQKETKKNDDIF